MLRTLLAAVFLLAVTACDRLPQELQATVLIQPANGKGHASGVIISKRTVLTNRHVAEAVKETGKITFQGGEVVEAHLVWVSAYNDLAMYEVEVPRKYIPARLACRAAVLDEEVTVIGHPLITKWNVTRGHVTSGSGMEEADIKNSIAIDAIVAPGNSGGPVFDRYGYVIGLAHAGLLASVGFGASFTGVNLMVPTSEICWQLGQ